MVVGFSAFADCRFQSNSCKCDSDVSANIVTFYIFSASESKKGVFEYQWPPDDKAADWFLLQEHISEFLGVLSFKRKYPGNFFTQLEKQKSSSRLCVCAQGGFCLLTNSGRQ
jgi:hypothetical protein